jgi:glycosyltransferase involved in cell wall biosynthesis
MQAETRDNLLDVIIPVKNGAKFLPDCLDRLVGFSNEIRILVADGNSEDKTLEIVDSYRSLLNIEVVSRFDRGQSDALNKCLPHISSRYFIWLNSDDLLESKFLEIILEKNAAKNFDVTTISANYHLIDEKGKRLRKIYCLEDRSWMLSRGIWFGKFPCIAWNTAKVREVDGIKTDNHFSMDFDLMFRLSRDPSFKNHHYSEFLGSFRWHDQNKTGYKRNLDVMKLEMAETLGRPIYWFDQLISIFVRVRSPRYLLYRFGCFR